MAKVGKKPTDDQLLEGGGRGASGRSLDADFYMPAGGATLVGAGLTALGAKNDAKREREAADEMKRETRGKQDSMTPGQKQSMEEAKDEEMRKKMKDAPTTKTEMGKPFAKGGTASSRADGIAQRGKTRGKMI